MSITSNRKLVHGMSLCADPAREECFKVVQRDSEMEQFEDDMCAAARREKLHRHMNNEIGSIEIAAQCLADFPDAPWGLRFQLARQTYDECRHVEGLHDRLTELGGFKGEFPISNFEWSVTNVQDSLAARLAIQNRSFEAGQMDLLGTLRQLWRAVGDERTAALIETILADEVNHVRFGNRWIRKLVEGDRRVLLKVAMAVRFLDEVNSRALAGESQDHQGRKIKDHARVGVNVEDRRNAEFSDDEINQILRQFGMGALASAKPSG